jgi:hypothetical protein
MYYRPKTATQQPVMLLAYVDDLLIAAKRHEDARDILRRLQEKWVLTDLGQIDQGSQVLGLKVSRRSSGSHLSQAAYIDRTATEYLTHGQRSHESPLPTPQENRDSKPAPQAYMEVIGCLMWIAGSTRPDIAFTAGWLARFSTQATQYHWKLAMRTFQYLKDSAGQGLKLGGSAGTWRLEGWVDADYAGCTTTRRSTTGYLFKPQSLIGA